MSRVYAVEVAEYVNGAWRELDPPLQLTEAGLAKLREHCAGIVQGEQGPPGVAGPAGADGEDGAQGPPGDVSACWPVKSVYITTAEAGAGTLLGFGTWVEIEQDKFPNAHFWRRTA